MRIILSTVMLSLFTVAAAAQPTFGYEDIRAEKFVQKSVSGVRSMNDGEHYTTREEGRIVKYAYRTGEAVDTLFTAPEGMVFENYELSGDECKLLLSTEVEPIYRHSSRARYWVYDLRTGRLTELSTGGLQQEATFSPDGSKVAFVRDNDLFVVDLADGSESRITQDGRVNHVLNGIPDWVYEEEFSFSRAFEWSPGSDKLAYMRFDESRVREYAMNTFAGGLYPEVYRFKYPKAGEENSVVEVWCHDLATGGRTRIDVGGQTDQYIPRILWTTGGELLVYRLNRAQNHFEVLKADPSGATVPIYDERNERYVERVDYGTLTFLEDGDRFVVRSEKDGFMHLYLYSIRDGLIGRLTEGPWEVVSVAGVSDGYVYYVSTEASPLKRDLYRVRLDGKGKQRLTGGDGTYAVAPSYDFRYFIAYFSNASTPNRVTLHASDGTCNRVLEDNAGLRERLKEIVLPVKEFFTFTTSGGTTLDGYMKKPADFDPKRRYPVFMVQYSGPGSQQVADSWSLGWEDVLVQEGYIVACVDGRGTGFRGEEFKKCTYKQLGRYEVEDQIEAARYLGSLPYVDAARIGIYGWSYGGFMALNCILKGNDVFKMAIAVAPVTSWRFYDTIYTELYNGTPQENPQGYDENSPIHFAERLKGKLLLAHGTGDDNVHIQNSYEMIEQLVKYDKPFELYIYPDKNHGMGASRHHLMERCLDFVRANL